MQGALVLLLVAEIEQGGLDAGRGFAAPDKVRRARDPVGEDRCVLSEPNGRNGQEPISPIAQAMRQGARTAAPLSASVLAADGPEHIQTQEAKCGAAGGASDSHRPGGGEEHARGRR